MNLDRHLVAVLALGAVLTSVPSCGGGTPDTPDATMTALFAGLAKDDPGTAWELMPPSYQQDVDAVVGDFAAKVDPALYDAGMGVARKLVQVLREKRDYVLAFPMLSMVPVPKEDLEKNWNDVTGMVAAVVDSQLKTHAGLKNLDVGAFLDSVGGKVMSTLHRLAGAEDWPDFAKAEATVVETSGETAKLKLTMPGQPDETVSMQRVDGHWVPEEMAKDWPDMMQQARDSIAKMAPASEAETKQVLAQIKQLEGVLEELLAADSKEKFDQALGKLMGAVDGR